MIIQVKTSGAAFFLSSLVGAIIGTALWFGAAVIANGHEIPLSELWVLPVLVAVYGLIAWPFAAMGLALFGLPATLPLKRYAPSWWVGAIALIWGAIAGKIMFYWVDQIAFHGAYRLFSVPFPDMGLCYGLPTGVAWWLIRRRQMARTASLAPEV